MSSSEEALKQLDESPMSGFHFKTVITAGMGFFTDAYDLFIIGVVMSLLKPIWHVGKLEEGLVESTALLASAIGALLFGRVADMLGRKRIYGVKCWSWQRARSPAHSLRISGGSLGFVSFSVSASAAIILSRRPS